MHNLKTTIFFIIFFVTLTAYPDINFKLQEKIYDKFRELTKNLTVETISPEKVLNLNKEAYILIDVRSSEEQDISMLPNSVTANNFEKQAGLYIGKKLIAYCTIGYRSGLFANKHKKLKIINLKGGVLAWSHNEGKFMKNGKETKKVHTYSKKWNFLNKNYQAVYR